MDPPVSGSVETEETRIREAYAKRQGDAARYSWFSPGHLFLIQERERRVLALLRGHGYAPLEGKRILEVGCGTGYWLREFVKWGARPEDLTGVELLPDRAAKAERLCPDTVKIQCGSATELGFPHEAFDLVLQSTVFTSVLDSRLKQRIASEMLRVVKKQGLILWYDFLVSNPRNPDVRGLKKREIRQLFPDCRVELQRITLAPPLARFVAPYSWAACYLLERVPWLCTHYLGAIRR
jgi:ubiquinone/menaquinone biosynthesis C-methylase UbiE